MLLKGSKTITVPESEVPTPYEDEISIPITTAIDPGGSPYGLYAKICHGIACGIVDALSPYFDNVITILGPPTQPQFRDLEIIGYDSSVEVGDYCDVRVRFDYQGPATSKTLYSAIGNAGVYFDESKNLHQHRHRPGGKPI